MKIYTEDFDGYVYNIEVEDNHNYFAETILVSNCHEDSTTEGKHGDIMNMKFIDTLRPWTELAIGGGNPLSHPQLEDFLQKCKSRNIICNLTVNQKHFVSQYDLVKKLLDNKLIYGLGVSVNSDISNIIDKVSSYSNIVLHTICGVMSVDDYRKLYDKNLKVLILGYKHFRRGNDYFSPEVEKNQKDLYNEMNEMLAHFKVVSFDNLAIKQLECERLLSPEEWEQFYMGDDGKYTMYIDGVNKKYVKSSISTIRKDLTDDIVEMFNDVRNNQ